MPNGCSDLIDVLKAEYRYINDFYPEGASTWDFKREHFIDPARMVCRLREVEQTREPLTQRIVDKLPPEAKAQLRQYRPAEMLPPESLQNAIVDVLNSLLSDPNLRNTPNLPRRWITQAQTQANKDLSGFRDVDDPSQKLTREVMRDMNDDLTLEITHETAHAIPRESTIRETRSFNRRLIEIAYRAEIKQIQNTLSAVYDHIHSLKPAALCLSGGGVRSSTFSLGIIQFLAERGLLNQFDYLSTVSGGGYIGSWLSAWSYRHPNGLCGVMNELKRGHNSASVSSKDPEPEPVSRLRIAGNYLTPKLGLFSGDSWALIGTYLRNLLLNWGVLVPLIAAVLIVPKLYAGAIHSLWTGASGNANPWASYGAVAVGLFLILMGALYMGFNRPSTGQTPRGEGSFVLLGLLPLLLGAVWLTSAFYGSQFSFPLKFGYFVLAGAGLKLLVWFSQLPVLTRGRVGDRAVPVRRDVEILSELVAAIVSGALTGLLVWVAAHSILSIATRGNLDFPNWYACFVPPLGLLLYACFAPPLLLLLFLVGETIFIGLVSIWTTDEDREWWARAGGRVLLTAGGWAVASMTVLFAPYLWASLDGYNVVTIIGSISGLLTIFLGKSAVIPTHGQAADITDTAKKVLGRFDWLQPLLANWSLKLATPIFIVFLIAVISSGVDQLATLTWMQTRSVMSGGSIEVWLSQIPGLQHLQSYPDSYPWPVLLVLLFAFVLISLLMAWFVDANKFSLNSGYRNRLVKAYLGASRNYRHPHPFTGFDPKDNLQMYQLADRNRFGFLKKNLFHVLNLSLNLVGGENLAWQERKAESFTVSPLHCGNHTLGYRCSTEYGRWAPPSTSRKGSFESDVERVPEVELPISLGFAMSLSGAAVSPNMGYVSSKPLAFLLTLFNVRLGGWLTNPSRCGDRARGKQHGYFALLYELFGNTNDQSPYVYLSDGGHFENLGLYEMVLRRCRHIVVIDAGHDPTCTFADLGKAINKIRTDLGVPIKFEAINIYPRGDKTQHEKRNYCAMGTIQYSQVDGPGTDGRLLYIKPAFYEEGDEPRDVYEYANRCAEFPHDSTADQWFGESQFESYRALGYYTLEKIAAGAKATSLEGFFNHVEQRIGIGKRPKVDELAELLGLIQAAAGTLSVRSAGVN